MHRDRDKMVGNLKFLFIHAQGQSRDKMVERLNFYLSNCNSLRTSRDTNIYIGSKYCVEFY
jgi:hypothetical protein